MLLAKIHRNIHLFFAVILASLLGCGLNNNKSKSESPQKIEIEGNTEFEFNEEIHNFGTLEAGEIVIFSFVVTNTGNNNLIIKNVDGGCGCMQTTYDKEPIRPGEKGIIEVEFDTSGLFGRQYKPISVEMNIKEKNTYLAVVAEVINKNLEINY